VRHQTKARFSPGFRKGNLYETVIPHLHHVCMHMLQRTLTRTGSDALSPWSGDSSATVEGGLGAGLQSPDGDGLQQAAQVRVSQFFSFLCALAESQVEAEPDASRLLCWAAEG